MIALQALNPPHNPQTRPPSTRDLVADEMAATVRGLPPTDLLWLRESLLIDLAEPGYADADSNAVCRALVESRLPEVEREIARRERAARRDTRVTSPTDTGYAAWIDVAAGVRDTVSVPAVLARCGHEMRRVGRDRDGRDEYHGPCPWCGGEDRYHAWDLPRSLYWCRRCEMRGDVITLWRNLHPGLGFQAAVEELVAMAGGGR